VDVVSVIGIGARTQDCVEWPAGVGADGAEEGAAVVIGEHRHLSAAGQREARHINGIAHAMFAEFGTAHIVARATSVGRRDFYRNNPFTIIFFGTGLNRVFDPAVKCVCHTARDTR
jgi:hypothetical protein